jgi:hypothetical protein
VPRLTADFVEARQRPHGEGTLTTARVDAGPSANATDEPATCKCYCQEGLSNMVKEHIAFPGRLSGVGELRGSPASEAQTANLQYYRRTGAVGRD